MPSESVQTVDYGILTHFKPHGNTKVLPHATLTRAQLIESVALLLEEMIEERCGRYSGPDEIPNKTIFHAKKLPSISIRDYLMRFSTYSNCHEDAFVYALIYLDKVGESVNEFSVDSFNVHRLILMCLVLACKFYDDFYYKNSYYARIGGVTTQEFNSLEQEFLVNWIDFALYVETDTYTSYYQDLALYNQTS